MAEIRQYNPTWMGSWKATTYDYFGATTPIRTGGNDHWYSYLGFPSQVLEDIEKSKSDVRIWISLHVTNYGEFDVGIHKMSYNYASDGLPFMRYVGLHPLIGSGREKIELTNFPSPKNTTYDRMEDALKDGYRGITLYSDGGNYGQAYGLTGDAYRAVIEVEGEWNTEPTKPLVQSPNGGESITDLYTLSALPATDAEQPQSQLRYQWGVYDGSWHYFWTSAPGVTDMEMDFSQFNETNVAKVAIRAMDSAESYSRGLFGDWDYSDGVFTIRHNYPPDQPSELDPSGGEPIDRTVVQEFTWRHNDAGIQSKYDFRWRLRGTTAWNESTRTTTQQRHFIESNVFPEGTIEWQVRTYDDYQLVSPWSSIELFIASDPAVRPEIVSPSDGEVIPESSIIVQWSAIEQRRYLLEIWNGNNQVYTEDRVSGNRATTPSYRLENNQTYTIRLQVENEAGLLSAYAEVTITTSFMPPPTPQLMIEKNNDSAALMIYITNPIGDELEPPVTSNSLYRRRVGQGEDDWLLLVEDLPRDGMYLDYKVASGVIYEYKIQAFGANGTDSESASETGSIFIKDVILSLADQPSEYVRMRWNPEKSFKTSIEGGTKNFQNRKYPLAEVGPGASLGISLSFVIRNILELDDFFALIQSRQTLMYRDSRGRKEFVIIFEVDVTDTASGNYAVSFAPERVYYKGDEEL